MEWEWEQIRAQYERLFEARAEGKTQEDIALAGGLSRQNQISRILRNRRRGPGVVMFVKGIVGLGMKPSEFFAQLERQSGAIDLVLEDSGSTKVIELKRAASPADLTRYAEAQAAFWEVMAGTRPSRRKRTRRR
jgi:transcriptional regulator with XRE-family HTH domain